MSKIMIYVSGKIEPKPTDKGTYREYVNIGKEAAVKLWNIGYGVICPHGNTDIDHDKITASYDDFIEADLIMLSVCDAIFMLPNWKNSNGAKMEHDYAEKNNIPIIYSTHQARTFIKRKHERCYITGRIRTGQWKQIENKSISPNMVEKIQAIADSRMARLCRDFSMTPKLNNTLKQDKKRSISR